MVYPGQNYRKIQSGRTAQVSSITKTHAVLYWPDRNENTTVSRERLERRPTEWKRLS